MGATTAGTYLFHQSWELEAERLSGLERFADPMSFRALDRIPLPPGARCLDVGAGAGSVARELAARVGPAGEVVAADLETGLLERFAAADDIEIRRLDVLSDDMPDGEFDLVHARFVLMHIPERDRALDALVSAARPGGWVMVTDMDLRPLYPVHGGDAAHRSANAFRTVMTLAGVDIAWAERLPFALEGRGLEQVGGEGTTGYSRGGDPGADCYRLSLERLREPILDNGLATADELDEAQALTRDPAWAVVAPAVWTAWGRRPLA